MRSPCPTVPIDGGVRRRSSVNRPVLGLSPRRHTLRVHAPAPRKEAHCPPPPGRVAAAAIAAATAAAAAAVAAASAVLARCAVAIPGAGAANDIAVAATAIAATVRADVEENGAVQGARR